MTSNMSRRFLLASAAGSFFAPSISMATEAAPIAGGGTSSVDSLMRRWIEIAPKARVY